MFNIVLNLRASQQMSFVTFFILPYLVYLTMLENIK